MTEKIFTAKIAQEAYSRLDITNTMRIPERITSIEEKAFENCFRLQISIPSRTAKSLLASILGTGVDIS